VTITALSVVPTLHISEESCNLSLTFVYLLFIINIDFCSCFSYVRNGVLYLKPTLVASEYGESFLYNGSLKFPD